MHDTCHLPWRLETVFALWQFLNQDRTNLPLNDKTFHTLWHLASDSDRRQFLQQYPLICQQPVKFMSRFMPELLLHVPQAGVFGQFQVIDLDPLVCNTWEWQPLPTAVGSFQHRLELVECFFTEPRTLLPQGYAIRWVIRGTGLYRVLASDESQLLLDQTDTKLRLHTHLGTKYPQWKNKFRTWNLAEPSVTVCDQPLIPLILDPNQDTVLGKRMKQVDSTTWVLEFIALFHTLSVRLLIQLDSQGTAVS